VSPPLKVQTPKRDSCPWKLACRAWPWMARISVVDGVNPEDLSAFDDQGTFAVGLLSLSSLSMVAPFAMPRLQGVPGYTSLVRGGHRANLLA
jgi:hypothetical protein